MRLGTWLTVAAAHLLVGVEGAAPADSSEPAQPPVNHAQPATDAYGDPLPAGARARLGTVRFRHPGPVRALAYSPDGKTLVSANQDGLRRWDAESGKELRQVAQRTGICALAFARKSKMLVSGDDQGRVTIWDLAGKPLQPLSLHDRQLRALAIAPDGKTLVTASDTICFWNTSTLDKGHDFKDATVRLLAMLDRRHGFTIDIARVRCLTMSSDGKLVAGGVVTSTGDALLLLDVSGKLVRCLDTGYHCGYSVAFAPDGKTLVAGGFNQLHFWDVATGERLRKVSAHNREIRSLAFSPDGRVLASSGEAHWAVLLSDPATGKKLRELSLYEDTANMLVFSPDGRTLAAGCQSGTIRLWDVATGQERFDDRGHQKNIEDVAFSPDGRLLASAGADPMVRIWDPVSGRALRTCKGHRSIVYCVAFQPAGRLLASGGQHDVIRLWDPATGKQVRQVDGNFGHVATLAFSPDGRTLASAGGDLFVSLWDVASAKKRGQLTGPLGQGRQVIFSRDGKLLAAAFGAAQPKTPTLFLWDMPSHKQVHSWTNGLWKHLIFTDDSRLLLGVNLNSGEMNQWEVPRGKIPWTSMDALQAELLALSPDGRMLAVSTYPNTIVLWELATRKERARFRGHQRTVMALAFAPDGRSLVSGSADTSMLIWDLTGWTQRPPRHELAAQELTGFWNDLADADAAKAYRASWALVAARRSAVRFLRDRLRAQPAVEAKRLHQLLADLQDRRFAVRHKATIELERLGELAVPALDEALKANLPLEARRRIESILGRLRPGLPPEQLRAIRAVEILEQLSTSEAGDVLRALAKGSPQATLTRHAQASLRRLAMNNKPAAD